MAAATFISFVPVNKQQIAYSKQKNPLIKPNRRRRSGSSTLCSALSSSSSSKTKQSQVSRRIEEEEMDDVEKLLESEMESMRLQQSSDQDEPDEEGGREVEAEDEAAGKADDWRDVINKVVSAVVVLRTTATRTFDTQLPGSYSATGFIVDKKRGIILTNRHVVTPGPVVAQATFVNHEEIPIHPLYRDPVHDFGFFRYEPGAIRFLDYEEIPLAPEAACVGLEIRVVGNDSCEKVSISAGTLARLDRNAPTYKKDGYNDFNTFYIQAASGTKGGSSGSPVIDRQGRVVALNAGNKTSSSSAFFLPLERVVRALQILQKGRDSCTNKWEAVAIPRGTLQVTFFHKGFDEARRLGLQNETEQVVRTASSMSGTGMLVVDSVVPGGPADTHLEPGDVLVCVNGKITTKFLDLETLLDNSVNQKIVLQIERGGRPLTVALEVQDLHSITPDHFLELSGAVIHPLSYQQARNFCFHCGLVYVSDPGYMLFRAGVPRHAIIKKFGDAEISRLEELILALSKLSRGARVPIEYITSNDRFRRKSVLVMIDQHEWYDTPKMYTRDDSSGLWIISPAFQPEPLQLLSCLSDIIQDTQISASSCKPTILGHMHQDGNQEMTKGANSTGSPSQHFDEETHAKEENDVKETKREAEGEFSADGVVIANTSQGNEENQSEVPSVNSNSISSDNKIAGASSNASSMEHIIEPSLVMLEVNVPPSCLLDGVRSQVFAGSGVVIHHSEGMGLVAVDRNTVPIFACDVMLSFASFPIEIPGQVVFLHPVYNYALVAYDPSALGRAGAATIRAAELLPEPALNSGDQVYLVGLSRSLQAMSRKSTVTNSCITIYVGSTDPPRYRATNMEVVELDSDFGCMITGVLSNEHGKVQALWGGFSNKMKSGGPSKDQQFVRGIPIYMISQVLEQIVSGANGPSLLINGVKRPMPLVRILEVELCRRLLSKARSFGLGEDWIQALVKKDPVRRQVLRVKGCFAGSKAESLLKEGDMLLAVNKEPVTCFRDLENACQTLEKCGDNDGKLNITIFRQGRQVDLLVGTDLRDGIGTTRVINWCGCIIQHPNAAVRALGFLPEEGHGVYVAKSYRGSPADRYGLHTLRWIVEVNGKPTPHLDAFLDVTKELGYEEFVRVRTINLNGKPQVLTLKQDLHYWPTWELRFDPDTAKWRRQTIKALNLSDE